MDPLTISLTIITGGFLVYYFLSRPMLYFKRLGVVYEQPMPIFGNIAPSLFRQINLADHLQNLYKKFSDVKYFGFYNFMNPVTVIRDPELIQSIGIKNFDHFTDHREFIDGKIDPLMGKNLFSQRGDDWKETRKILSPAFTASKIKQMYGLIIECAENFVEHIRKESKGGAVINTKDIFSKYTNDVLATCAFGISVDSMRNPSNDFYVRGKEATNLEGILSIKFLLGRNLRIFSKIFGTRIINERTAHYFETLIGDTVTTRDKQGIIRPDMIQLMMETRNNDKALDLSLVDMTSQAFIFFFAGSDTTSSFICFLAHELAVNPEFQDRLRSEVDQVVKETNGEPTYDAIQRMKYLDAVVNETLRLYPMVQFLDRACVKEFVLPPATSNGRPVTLKPGDMVWFPSYALHRDPQYFPNPSKFDPARFLNGEVNQSVFFPFGIGPRSCIGNRFGLMKIKILIFYLLWNCYLEPCSKTTIPMVLSKKAFLMMAENGFWLKFQPRDNVDSSCGKEVSK